MDFMQLVLRNYLPFSCLTIDIRGLCDFWRCASRRGGECGSLLPCGHRSPTGHQHSQLQWPDGAQRHNWVHLPAQCGWKVHLCWPKVSLLLQSYVVEHAISFNGYAAPIAALPVVMGHLLKLIWSVYQTCAVPLTEYMLAQYKLPSTSG
jgi:hypothetical protein